MPAPGTPDKDGNLGRNHINHPRRVNYREFSLQVLELRKAGATFQAMADQLGRSKWACVRAFQKAMIMQRADLERAADENRALELARLDHMLVKLWPRVNKADEKAIDRALKIGERRAFLLGLDAPQKIAPTTPDGTKQYQPRSDTERFARIEEILLAAQRRRTQKTPP